MTINNIILKTNSHILLAVMLYMHICSAWCAIFSGGCCSDEKDHSKKSICRHEKTSNEKEGNCQDYHLSFFNAAGQFASEKNVEAVKVFSGLEAIVTPLFIIKAFDQGQRSFAYNGFHPPPPVSDIRILIQSFQI